MLPTLYETFLDLCGDYRHRMVPLRMSTLDGLRVVAEHGFQPDLIYVDAEHSYEAVTADIEMSRDLFPNAVIVGDDYDWPGIAAAVVEAGQRHHMKVELAGVKELGRAWRLAATLCDRNHQTVRGVRSMSMGEDLFALGSQIPQLGGLQQIEQNFQRIVQVDPNNGNVYFVLGALAHRDGRHEAAVDSVAKAIAIDPTNSDYHCVLGSAYMALGRSRPGRQRLPRGASAPAG